MYKLNGDTIIRLHDGMGIPFADGNGDYEEYKQWLSDSNTPQPQYTAEELTEKETAESLRVAKEAKDLALNTATVTITSGKVFDARDKDLVRMMGAISTAERNAMTATKWKLNNNIATFITLDELKEAHDMTMFQLGQILVGN